MKAIAIKLSEAQQTRIKAIEIRHNQRNDLSFEGEALGAHLDVGRLLEIIRQGAVE